MQSQKIYQIGKMMLETSRADAFITGKPDSVSYECLSAFEPEFSLSVPCRALFIARYQFNNGFSLQGDGLDTYDILYVCRGALSLSLHNGAGIPVERGNVLFLRSSDKYSLQKIGEDVLDIVILRTGGFLSTSYYGIIDGRKCGPIFVSNPTELNRLFERVAYYMKFPTNFNNVLVSHTMSALFVEIFVSANGIGDKRNSEYIQPQWFVQTMDRLEKNYSGDFSMSSLAEAVEMSESKFYKVFKEYTGLSPYQYLTKVRIDHAKTLLNTTDFQIKYISATVGFRSVNHFISHFKEAEGCTPSEYRDRKYRTGGLPR